MAVELNCIAARLAFNITLRRSRDDTTNECTRDSAESFSLSPWIGSSSAQDKQECAKKGNEQPRKPEAIAAGAMFAAVVEQHLRLGRKVASADASDVPESDKPRSSASPSSSQEHQLLNTALIPLLERYILTDEQLSQLGYPTELKGNPGYVVIRKMHQFPQTLGNRPRQELQQQQPEEQKRYCLDANAREFVPGHLIRGIKTAEPDSRNMSTYKSTDIAKASPAAGQCTPVEIIERRCARCFKPFFVNGVDGEYLFEEQCHHHWGKLRIGSWECCARDEISRGCTTAKAHVWTGIVQGCNGPYCDYSRTRSAGAHTLHGGNYGAYAIDCEMYFTKRGLELGRITVVDLNETIVYDELVKPDVEVVDYNSRFSGLRAEDMAKATKSLREVQKDITSFVFAETILIGHGLDSDLRALKMIHPTCIDTSVTFPHYLGLPFRSSLKMLVRTMLKRDIQVREHNSAEDARATIQLLKKKLGYNSF